MNKWLDKLIIIIIIIKIWSHEKGVHNYDIIITFTYISENNVRIRRLYEYYI